MWYDFWEFRVIMVCSSTERVTVLFWVCCRLEVILKEECCIGGGGGDADDDTGPIAAAAASVSEWAAAVERLKRCSDSLKLGPDSMALSSPDLSE